MRYGLYKKTHFENFGNRAFCQRTAEYGCDSVRSYFIWDVYIFYPLYKFYPNPNTMPCSLQKY